MISLEDLARKLYESKDEGRGTEQVPWTLRQEIVKDAWRSVAQRQLKLQG